MVILIKNKPRSDPDPDFDSSPALPLMLDAYPGPEPNVDWLLILILFLPCYRPSEIRVYCNLKAINTKTNNI